MELPIAFAQRMKALLGAEYDAFEEALLCEDAVKGLRVNRHKVATEVFEKHAPFSLEKLSYAEDGFIVSEEAQAGKHPYHHAGVYYMQDPGAMATVAALPDELWTRRGLKVLDLCAAPGGKTTQIASVIASKEGVVLANEYNTARSRVLAGNVERMGLDNVCVTNTDTGHIAEWYPALFDLVVVDAPCSGEGMFRKNALAISEWNPDNVALSAMRQKEILANGAACLAQGGYLLYSTCTYSIEENEKMIANFLSEHPNFRLCPCKDSVVKCTADGVNLSDETGVDLSLCRRFYPHRSPGEGQFVALLQREEDGVEGHLVKDALSPLSKQDRSVAENFLSETVGRSMPGLCLCGGNVSLFPAREKMDFPIPPFGVVSLGAALGTVQKGRILPHHHFFTAYGAECASRLLLDPVEEAVTRYLAGEELSCPTELRGFTALMLRLGETAVTLGGGKASGGRLKNYYPKGLRVR